MDYMELQDVFTVNLRKYRKQASLTQEKLAELCDTDPRYIGQLETGRRCPSFAYIEKIASALSIEPYQLFYDEFEVARQATVAANNERKRQIKTALIERISQGIQSVIDDLY
jgi:transcriptional regulator with XRE-family HTH domain